MAKIRQVAGDDVELGQVGVEMLEPHGRRETPPHDRFDDGSGLDSFTGDVAIDGDRLAQVGGRAGAGRREIDASGLVIAPGFIDPHTHYDAQLFWDRMLTISPWHGVTSVVIGNCGFGIAPTRPEHRDLILRTLENVEGMSLDALRAGVGDEPRRVLDELKESRVVDVVLPTRQGVEIRKRCITKPTDHQQIQLHRLGLELPSKIKMNEM